MPTPTHHPITGEKQGCPTYRLGTPDCRTLYTAFGSFPSGMAAADFWKSKPRSGSGVAVIWEERDAIMHDVVYGLHASVVARVAHPNPFAGGQ